jgi:hypothetical protein
MANVLEFIKIKKKADFTAVPQLGITNHLSALQLQSQQYFTINDNAQAKDGNFLAVSVLAGQKFNPTRPSLHTNYLNACTVLFKEKAQKLKELDKKIMGSVLLGVVASSLSFLPLVGYFSWLGWGSALYHMHARGQVYKEYHESLTLLVANCNWSLGQNLGYQGLSQLPAIREMMAALYPVLTETQVKHLIADEIEKPFAQELINYENRFNANSLFAQKDNNIALSKKGAEFSRCIYGFNRGSATDFLDAFLSILPDLYRAARDGLKQLKHRWNEGSKKEDVVVPASTYSV